MRLDKNSADNIGTNTLTNEIEINVVQQMERFNTDEQRVRDQHPWIYEQVAQTPG
jgi:hypothetical protein